jgi:acetolactate synthase-1/2/3 large subunit
MKVVDVIAEILKREGVEFLSCYPTNTMIEAAATAGIRPIVCRQERVGVGIADGFTRVTNGKRIGVFSMQAVPARRMRIPASPRLTRTRHRFYSYPSATRATLHKCTVSSVR